MGVDYVQGYVVSKPLLPEQILLANSAADCILDEGTARFVKDSLGAILLATDRPDRDRYN